MKLLRACGFLAIASTALLAFVPPAWAWGTATYKMVVSPATVAGGAPAKFKLALTNTSSGRAHLESANVVVPAAFKVKTAAVLAGSRGTASVSGNTVAVRDVWVARGATLYVSVTTTAPCPVGSYTWRSAAKQDADFDGPSLTLQRGASRLTTHITSPCQLRFVTEPHNAVVGQPITGRAFDSSGPPVTLAIYTGSGALLRVSGTPVTVALKTNPGAATLGGTTTQTTVDGLATFGDLSLNKPGDGYKLSASAPKTAGATSTAFNEVDAATRCAAGQTCQVSASTTVSSLTVTQPGVSGATLSASVDVGTALQCTGYRAQDPNWFSFVSSTTAVGKQVRYQLNPSAQGDRGGIGQLLPLPQRPLQFCFGAPYEFKTRTGHLARKTTLPDGTTGFVGLLPVCSKRVNGPCISSRSGAPGGDAGQIDGLGGDDDHGGQNVITVSIPANLAADPWGRV